jgi:hypothetical protein
VEVLETPGDFGNLGRLESCQPPYISLMSLKQSGTFGKYPDFPKVPLN